eukprot:g8216.t1
MATPLTLCRPITRTSAFRTLKSHFVVGKRVLEPSSVEHSLFNRQFVSTGGLGDSGGNKGVVQDLPRGTVSIDVIYKKLKYLAHGLKTEEERNEALAKISKAFESHKNETDENKIQQLLADAQSHLSFYKMVSRRRLPAELDEEKDELSMGQHFVMDKKTGKLVETDSVLSDKLVANKNKIIDKSQVTAEHRRKHEQLLRRQHFMGRK